MDVVSLALDGKGVLACLPKSFWCKSAYVVIRGNELASDVVSFALEGESAIALPAAVAMLNADNRIAMRFMIVPFSQCTPIFATTRVGCDTARA
jgi:hypothetical protein